MEVTEHKHKPQAKRTKSGHIEDAGVREKCPVDSLPLELLAEILSYTTPRDILALARTSKYFCATLVTNPASTFIWKRARARYEPAIPDPTPNLTEPAYAALLFDAGVCEKCGKPSTNMYASFAMRMRFCRDNGSYTSCRMMWIKSSPDCLVVSGYDNERYTSILQWIPRMEYRNFGFVDLYINEPVQEPVGVTVRRKDWVEAVDEYNKAALSEKTMAIYNNKKNLAAKTHEASMKLARELVRWRNGCLRRQEVAFQSNMKLARILAKAHGWALWDVLSTKSFGTLYRTKNKSAERIEQSELADLEASIFEDIQKMTETRKRRKDENEYRERRNDVAQLYENLKDGISPMPPLPEFRKLPTVQRIQYKPQDAPSPAIAQELKQSKLAIHLVKEEIAQWSDEARRALHAVLGHSAWEWAGSEQLDPVDRLTARFRCKKCDDKGRLDGWENISLDFDGVCQHLCKTSKQERANERWQAENFVPDVTAIDVVERLLARLECAADDVRSIETVASLGSRIICLSCQMRIRMDFPTLLRHCYRHEKMQLDIVPEHASADDKPFERGLRAKLIMPSAEAERQRRIYICRHCLPSDSRVDPPNTGSVKCRLSAAEEQDPDVAHASSEVDNVTRNAAESHPPKPARRTKAARLGGRKLLSFDGLRSHAKDKHGIEWIGDEDFYRLLPDSTTPATLPLP